MNRYREKSDVIGLAFWLREAVMKKVARP